MIIIDPSGTRDQQVKFDAVRSVVQDRLHTIVYTHGHIDHIFGVQQYLDEAVSNGWPRPQVFAHEDALPRFKRYRETAGYNGTINSRRSGEAGFNSIFRSIFIIPISPSGISSR